MKKQGILLAVSSLPGQCGIGDFGSEAFSFIKLLSKHNINLWQILPLNPIGYGHSPYQPYSSYAIDEIYISLEDLKKQGLISSFKKVSPTRKTNYELARKIKEQYIEKAFKNFLQNSTNLRKLKSFLKQNKYIDQYVTFISLKEMNNFKQWNEWTIFESNNLECFNILKLKHGFAQMMLFEQWNEIRTFAKKNNITIIGDVPFYVGYDSSDVYFSKESFALDENNKPLWITGVPPDYFSKEGQRWGNPIWNWDYLYEHDFEAMMDRIYFASNMYDIVRIDHFRAFDSYWAINPACPTAVDGEWRYPDGYRFFRRLYEKYPDIQIVAEDLGLLRQEVLNLRDYFNLAGMRLVEFTIFEDEFENNRVEKENQIYYTTTHDNETLKEWINNLKTDDRKKLAKRMKELHLAGDNLVEKLIHYALIRKEKFTIISVTDILNMGISTRMNIPGTVNENNWTFKMKSFDKISKELKKYF